MIRIFKLGLLMIGLITHSYLVFAGPLPTPVPKPAVEKFIATFNLPIQSDDYNQMFKYSRELLTRKPVQDLLKSVFTEELKIDPALSKMLNIPVGGMKEVSEHQFVLLLQMNKDLWPMLDDYIKEVPEIAKDDAKQLAIRQVWTEKFKKVLEDPAVKEKFIKYNNPLEPRVLQTLDGNSGYRNTEFYANTLLKYKDGKMVQPSNLKQKWIDFIKKAEKQIVLNVFDFDLTEVADALIERGAHGVDVRVGIYNQNIVDRPEVKAVFDRLQQSGKVKVFAVNSVGLNHQKLCARDWEVKGKGAVLASSGNLTQSCSGPEGDGIGKVKSKYSIPNANHLVMMDTDVGAQLVNHELTKTLDMGLRGSDYPLSGAWMILADTPKVALEKRDNLILAFSPNGALGDINDQMIAEMVRQRKGELKAIQFVISSKGVDDAFYNAAIEDIKKTGTFKFKGVGDTPFAGRDYSVFLDMIGYVKDPTTGVYALSNENRWNQLPDEVKKQLRKFIKAAPVEYGEHSAKLADGTSMKLSSKIHDKVLMDDEKGFFGTSFNFSDNALGNNETIILFKDKKIIKDGQAMFDGLDSLTTKTLEQVVIDKNRFAKPCENPVQSVLQAIKPPETE